MEDELRIGGKIYTKAIGTLPGGTEKNDENISQYCYPLSRDLNSGASEAGLLTARFDDQTFIIIKNAPIRLCNPP
jgi:hypothetical protein